MKKICVIGAGVSGLSAIKSCKEENLDVDCFEMSDNFGGVWRYHDDDADGCPSVMKSTIINTSKEMSAFSDFPPPKEYANFMHNSYMLKYFEMYVQRFDLLKHIQFKRKVVKAEMADDYESTGKWLVTVQHLENGSLVQNVYDGLMVCAGHHTFPYVPEFEGIGDFQGKVVHTHSLKDARGYEGKKVLVIGIGNSAVDAAVEISRVSEKLYVSSRRGSWIFHRVGPFGIPYDVFLGKRFFQFLADRDVFHVADTLLEFYLDIYVDHKKFELKPKHRVLSAHFTINDNFPNCILSGRVILKNIVQRFTKNGVVFEGEDEVTEVDDVVLATGYEIRYPFLSEEIFKVAKNNPDLYKRIFPAHLTHPSLAFIGLIQPLGCIFPIAEAQSRWYAQLMAGTCHLPSPDQMKKEIKDRHESSSKRYADSPRHTIQVDYMSYMDEICREFGAKPNLWKLALTDPVLFYYCAAGPCVPYQYRLEGPHAWSEARSAIISVQERIEAPLKTCKRP